LVDVRTSEEYAQYHVDGAINIPLKRLKKSISAFKVNIRPVLFYCKSGRRSQKAYLKAYSEGIECYNGGAIADVEHALNRHQYIFVSRPNFINSAR
jgi:rhodanese-related sulfurtransferase